MLKFDDFKYRKDAPELPMSVIFEKLVTPFNNKVDAYVTLDNGGEPFIVKYDEKNKRANIYKQEERLEVKHIFDGTQDGKGDRGTSLLLQLEDNKYVFVGDDMYEFTTDDKIKEYYSVIGNSGVPYPVAVGEENIYFMVEGEYASKEDFKEDIDWANEAYGYFYGHIEQEKEIIKHKMKDYKVIIKRTI